MKVQIASKLIHQDAVVALKEYFAQDNGRPRYSGSHFESLAGGGDRTDANTMTANDLVAVSMLSVQVPPIAALGILETYAEDIAGLLGEIPTELKFEDLTREEFERFLAAGSPAAKLWDILRQREDRWGVGQTIASKLLARKRPHLIPIYDSVIGKVTNLQSSATQWDEWYAVFHEDAGDEPGLAERLRMIRAEADQPQLSLLRVLDIALWRRGKLEGLKADPAMDEA